MFNNERRDRDLDDELRAYVRGAQLAEPRLTTTLLSLFATLALILTATGLAGVIGYGVMRRALRTDPAGVSRRVSDAAKPRAIGDDQSSQALY